MNKNIVAMVVAASCALPMTAQATDLTVSGDFTGFYRDSLNDFNMSNSEVNFSAKGEVFFGRAELDFNANGDAPKVEEVYVGMKIGDGEIRLGDTDNACDVYDPGVPDLAIAAGTGGGCKSNDKNLIIYKAKTGEIEYAVSYNPKTNSDIPANEETGTPKIFAADDPADQTSIAVRFPAGPAKINLGYVDDNGESNVHFGIKATFGGLTLAAEANDNENADDLAYGIYATYVVAQNTFWAAVDDLDNATVAYVRRVNDSTRAFIEVDLLDEANERGDDTDFAIGVRYDF